ncbi:MAG TPA: transporter associated domain-containing protein, partial [Euzebya sp.]|nr:transporter associated domain-containing protein [Euzebya sp.]
QLIDADSWRVDARLPVNDLADLAGTPLPDEHWDTVGGLVYGLLGRVPRPGEAIQVEGLRLVAERVRGRRIVEILVHRAAGDATADQLSSAAGTERHR